MATIADILDKVGLHVSDGRGWGAVGAQYPLTREVFEAAMRSPRPPVSYTAAKTIREKWIGLQYHPIHASIPRPESGRYILDVGKVEQLIEEVRLHA